ncbi:MAG: 4Fe-4S dicluster domain-containing protein [Chloroflexi bacterium]|nr:4Fe-4S dicluster domain-containing protein [Chloroflexota bacterium]
MAGVETTKQKPSRVPLSEGYLVVDSKKCAGCMACMLACSLVYEGIANLSLSRIQVIQTTFKPFPEDITISICRQCANPICMKSCPTEALHVDAEHGNIRVVDESLCDGCKLCIEACPYPPSRVIWNQERHVAVKCDLCAGAQYRLEVGGPHGKQACVEACPMRAIRLVHKVPNQRGDDGYNVNLRNEHWGWLGYPTD